MKRSALWRLTTGIFTGLAAFIISANAQAFVSPRIKPPAPGPAYMTRSDQAQLLAAAEALKSRQYALARAQIAQTTDPIARSLGEWMYFIAEDPQLDFVEAGVFLDAHYDWPASDRIQIFTEKKIPDTAPAEKVLGFFERRDPLTGEGKIQLVRALFSTGQNDAAEQRLKDAWINNNFSTTEERKILSNYGSRLSKDDHAARVDRLLWERQVTNARRIIPKLETRERRMAEARAALLVGASSAPVLYRNLQNEERMDSGVLLAAVRYFRRTGEEEYAISLAKQSPKDPQTLRNSNRWWYERQLLMRWALKEGRFADAYAAAADNGLEPGGDFAEAEFNAGWIALRFLNDPTRAETHFLALASAVGTPISLSRAYYWLGRTAEAKGADDLASAYYQSAAQFYYSYYGQLAAEELGGTALNQRFAPPTQPTANDRALFASRPTVAALRMLSDLNLEYEFMVFAYHIDDQLERPGEYLEFADLTNGEGAPHLTVRAGKVAIQKDAFTPAVAYPVIFVPEEAKRYVEPEIILGLSRQESEFNPRAFSRAGARGVMQLIPTTAQLTARKEGLVYSRTALLDDPVYNITIGSAHLSHLLERFGGSYVMTFAAYNAGVTRVETWINEYGDPRSTTVDPIDWVELIPFNETRNYVQRVLENIQVYRGQLNDAPIPGQLIADLEVGGPKRRAALVSPPSLVLASAGKNHGSSSLPPIPESTVRRAKTFAASLNFDANGAPVAKVEKVAMDAAAPAPSSAVNQKASRKSKKSIENDLVAQQENTTETAPAPEAISLTDNSSVVAPSPQKQKPPSQSKLAREATMQTETVDSSEQTAPASSNPANRMDRLAQKLSEILEASGVPQEEESGIADLKPAIADQEEPAPALPDDSDMISSVFASPAPGISDRKEAAEEKTENEIVDSSDSEVFETVDAGYDDTTGQMDSDTYDSAMGSCLSYREFLENELKKDPDDRELSEDLLKQLLASADSCQ